VHPATAVGTDLLYAAATKTGGTIVHGLSGTIRWIVVRRLATGSVPATALTLFILSRIPLSSAARKQFIGDVLGFALLLTAIVLVFPRQIVEWYGARIGELSKRQTAWLTVITGATLGVLVSISSVGAGALGATMLVLLYPRISMAQIVGSDIAHAVPLVLLAGIGHWLIGSVNIDLIGTLLLGSLPGIVLGSRLAVRTPDRVLQFTLAIVLAVAGGRLVSSFVVEAELHGKRCKPVTHGAVATTQPSNAAKGPTGSWRISVMSEGNGVMCCTRQIALRSAAELTWRPPLAFRFRASLGCRRTET
jgi:uncharacterized protein